MTAPKHKKKEVYQWVYLRLDKKHSITLLIIDIFLHLKLNKFVITHWFMTASSSNTGLVIVINFIVYIFDVYSDFPWTSQKPVTHILNNLLFTQIKSRFIQHIWSHTNSVDEVTCFIDFTRFYLFFGKCNAICSQFFFWFSLDD